MLTMIQPPTKTSICNNVALQTNKGFEKSSKKVSMSSFGGRKKIPRRVCIQLNDQC